MSGNGIGIYFIGTVPPLLLAVWLIAIALAARDPGRSVPPVPPPQPSYDSQHDGEAGTGTPRRGAPPAGPDSGPAVEESRTS